MRFTTIIYAGLIVIAKRFLPSSSQNNMEDEYAEIGVAGNFFSETCTMPDFSSFERNVQCPSDPIIHKSLQFFSKSQVVQEVQELSQQVNVRIAPHLVKYLEERGLNQYYKSLQYQAAMVIKLLPTVVSPRLLAPILSDPSFSIEITDHTNQPGVDGRPDAVYLPWSNKILLIADSDWTDTEMHDTLRNEFHHAMVRYQNMQLNQQNGTSREASLPMIYPFLKKDAGFKPSKTLIAQHKAALGKGFDRILLLKKLFNSAAFEKDPLLLQFQEIILNYEPKMHRDELDKKYLTADSIERIKKAVLEKSGQAFSKNSDGSPYYIRMFYNYKDSVIVKYVYNKDDSWQEKAKAFFADMVELQGDISSAGYSTRKPFEKDMETSSSLQELPDSILRFVFPEWCQYFDDYNQLDDGEYCADIPSLPH